MSSETSPTVGDVITTAGVDREALRTIEEVIARTIANARAIEREGARSDHDRLVALGALDHLDANIIAGTVTDALAAARAGEPETVTEWGVRYPSGRIVETSDTDPAQTVSDARKMGLDVARVAREVTPWVEVQR